ncbi:MAG TPA: elongation factor 1-beta [Ignisphaera sp.]|nr:elongation factor 1-beta [Ignisphaera sp.]
MSGKVIAVIRAYPKDIVSDFTGLVRKLKEKLPKDRYEIVKWEPIDIAFGYRALEIYFLMPEELEGGTEELENIVKSIEDIDNVDVVYVSRIQI